ncbi:MAG: Na+-transporting NADH:ubiquinone oxidoreductase subunit F [Arenicella sp.]|jgi:Na+-transporting NADH:ubiquinone oxidoreductase subunit F
MRLRTLHKWLGIVIGLQVLIWVTSGTIISLLDQQIVGGRSTKQAVPAKQVLGNAADLVPLQMLSLNVDEPIISVRLERVVSQLVYRVKTTTQSRSYNAKTGAIFSLEQQIASQIASHSYRGQGLLINSDYLSDGSEEVPGAGAVWRIDFDDGIATRVYVSALDGAVVAHRNRYWKVVDFLLMLHFMDYFRAHHFNNPQIIIVGFLALWLTLSGLLLVKANFRRRDFTWRGLTR